jgi:hypothetical protein
MPTLKEMKKSFAFGEAVGLTPCPREAPRPQRGAPDKSSGPCARGAAEGPSPP